MSSILEKERNKGKKRRFSQTDTKEEGARLIASARKRSVLPKGISTLKKHIPKNMYEHKKNVFVLEFDEEDDDEYEL